MKKILFFLSLLATATLLQGCFGSGGSSAPATVRLVNGTSSTLDMVSSGTNNMVSSGATLASAIAYGGASSSVSIATGLSTIALENSGTGIPLISTSTNYSFSSGVDYTVLAYTSGQNLYTTSFTDNEVAPTSGSGKIRIADLASAAGSVDVYMAVQSTALLAAQPLATNISGSIGSYAEVPQATYHIWVTGAGNKTDLRLDIPSIVISDQQILTLVLTGTSGGVLVDGLLITQHGAVVAEKNTNARVRLVANFGATENITSATVNAVPLVGSTASTTSMSSPSVGSYALVPAGSLTLAISVNGAPITGWNTTATAGTELTLLAAGSASSPQYFMLNDDNTRPTSGYSKLRLVHGINSQAGSLSLSYDYIQIATGVNFGTASTSVSVASGNNHYINVNGLYTIPSITLQSQGVYSLFMLGNSSSLAPILIKDN